VKSVVREMLLWFELLLIVKRFPGSSSLQTATNLPKISFENLVFELTRQKPYQGTRTPICEMRSECNY